MGIAADLVAPGGALAAVSEAAADNNTLAVTAAVTDAVTYIVASLSPEQRSQLSWSLSDMVTWCTYEEKECDMK